MLIVTHACCADHYTGINENWSAGPIYCSEVTAQLVVHLTGVQQQFVHPLPMEKPMVIQGAIHTTALPKSHLTPPPTRWPHAYCAPTQCTCYTAQATLTNHNTPHCMAAQVWR
jgi:hypothetical protein